MTLRQLQSIGAIVGVAIIIASTTGYLGYRAGNRSARQALSTSSFDQRAAEESAHAATTVRALRLLRGDEYTKALEVLESNLDMSIVAIISLSEISQDPRLLHKSARLQIWADVKDYRQQYPSQSEPAALYAAPFWRSFPGIPRAP